MRVFISHSSKDKPAVEAFALALHERNIDPWLDKWEIGPGDDIVAKINAGLEEADAGIVIFSRHSRESRWVESEISSLTYARIVDGKNLIPVMLGEEAWVPPLLRPLARRGIEEIDAIVDGLLGRRSGPPPRQASEWGRTETIAISLSTEESQNGGNGVVSSRVEIGGSVYSHSIPLPLSRGLMLAQADFLRGIFQGAQRNPTAALRSSQVSTLRELGQHLRQLCLPEGAGAALTHTLDNAPIGTTVDVCFAAADSQLLGLPFETLLLPDDRLLATHPAACLRRQPMGLSPIPREPLAGPLKILVAVGAPDENYSSSGVLDQERELQNILDAFEQANRLDNAEVRILEVGHPDEIAAAIAEDAYHILHLSCHGSPGQLELEDEDGRPVPTSAAQLIDALQRGGRPLPLILLSACHSGAGDGETAGLAETLLRAGIPGVLAMQTTVSDRYATALAGAFYRHLASREHLLASRALAASRRELEKQRQAAIQQGSNLEQTQPEYATATLFVAGEERPLANFGADKVPLRRRPVHELTGPLPQLRMDELIGRRRQLRDCLQVLRDPERQVGGLIVTGTGGVGKSTLLGRVMRRLKEDGWWLAAHRGRFDLSAVSLAVGMAVLEAGETAWQQRGKLLLQENLPDVARLQILGAVLAESPLLLVLDDFEDNLHPGGEWVDPELGELLGLLLTQSRRGCLAIASRYPVKGLAERLARIDLGPLSRAEIGKLVLRLPALQELESRERSQLLRMLGGHPRILELFDAILRQGRGRLPQVTDKLKALTEGLNVDLENESGDLRQQAELAVTVGARDICLQELLERAEGAGLDEVLLQLAVSNLPVTVAGLARMLDLSAEGDVEGTRAAIESLADLALVYRPDRNSAWVHRWTAEGLAQLANSEAHQQRYRRAGDYRIWRVQHESHSLEDGFEAVRNYLAGAAFDAAADWTKNCCQALVRFQQMLVCAALASEVLESLPASHGNFAVVADFEAKANLALGRTEPAFHRYHFLVERYQALTAAEPERADYQRDLSVSYNKMGDLYRALGQGELARDAYANALAIRERLAAAEPERADYQRDLSFSLVRVAAMDGDIDSLQRALSLLLALQESGRALPNDEAAIAAIRQMLQDLT
ncbi:MAG: CHAT domain-containing protein [Cyanobacteria bacterium P01_F01_bin.33]